MASAEATNKATDESTTGTTINSKDDEPAIQTEVTTVKDENDIILTSSKRHGVYECDYCHNDITQTPRIRSAVCQDFDLCLDCFTSHVGVNPSAALLESMESMEAEGKSSTEDVVNVLHDPTKHGYRVCDSTRYPIFPTAKNWERWLAKSGQASSTTISNNNNNGNDDRKDDVGPMSIESEGWNFKADDPKMYWTVEEDLRLLEGIKNHGLGNWGEISESVSGCGSVGKTPKRCMERYLDDYLGRFGNILPPYTLVPEEMSEGGTDATNSSTSVSVMDVDKTQNASTVASTAGADAAVVREGSTSDLPVDTAAAGGGNHTPGNTVPAATDAASRSSKRRAALFRTPVNSNTLQNQSVTLASRKRYRIVATESLAGYNEIWPKQYVPLPTTVIGQEVGRDSSSKAEQAYVKLISAAQNKDEVEKIHQEWERTRLMKPGGPTALPPRPEDTAEMSGAELAGFMPRRGDFDVEHENDAEETIGDMEFLPGDSEEDRKVKLKVLAIYNEKLDKREARKKFVLSRKLWNYRKIHQDNEKLPRDERDLAHRMRLFERFHTPKEHQAFLDDVLKAKRLRKEIAKLQMYRRMGIRTLAEAEKYELDKTRRHFHKTASGSQKPSDKQQQKSTSATAGPKKDVAASPRAGEDVARKIDDMTTSTSLWKQYRTPQNRGVRKSVNRGDPKLSELGGGEATNSQPNSTDPMTADPSPGNTKAQSELFPSVNDSQPESISPQELDLCKKVGLTTPQYREIKKVLIHESLEAGLLDKEGAGSSRRALIKMDIERRGDLIDFFLRAGWVSASHFARSLTSHLKK